MSHSLTVTEKQHWKDRIEKRIDRQIDAISAEEPGFMENLKDAARKQAAKSLGIEKLAARLDRMKRQQQILQDREATLRRTMFAAVRGVPAKQARDIGTYSMEREVDAAIANRQAVHEEELLMKTKRGRTILELRKEKETLLDTVWLATSPKQIKDLWQKVASLLGEKPTQLERDALAIKPMEVD